MLNLIRIEKTLEIIEQGYKAPRTSDETGPQGIQGIEGPIGPNGTQGPAGPQGPQGQSGSVNASNYYAVEGIADSTLLTPPTGIAVSTAFCYMGGIALSGGFLPDVAELGTGPLYYIIQQASPTLTDLLDNRYETQIDGVNTQVTSFAICLDIPPVHIP